MWLHDVAHLLHSWQLVKRSGVLPLLLPYGARDSICSALCLTVKEASFDYKNYGAPGNCLLMSIQFPDRFMIFSDQFFKSVQMFVSEPFTGIFVSHSILAHIDGPEARHKLHEHGLMIPCANVGTLFHIKEALFLLGAQAIVDFRLELKIVETHCGKFCHSWS